jgi:hypothetical protein
LDLAFYSKINSSIEESEFDVSQVAASDYRALKSEEKVPFKEK